jgi:hypothetical protein
LVAAYVAIVLCVAFAVPGNTPDLHYTAARYLPANTRLDAAMLVAPQIATLEDRVRLKDELNRLTGRYVKHAVNAGEEVRAGNVSGWPRLGGEELGSVEIAVEPDWMLVNSGAEIEISANGKVLAKGVILAIVPSSAYLPTNPAGPPAPQEAGTQSGTRTASPQKWLLLLRRADLGTRTLDIKDGVTLHIRRLATAATPRSAAPIERASDNPSRL